MGLLITGAFASLTGDEALTNKTLATSSTLIAGSKISIGNTTSTSTATPEVLSLGGTFSSTAGANPKLRVYDSGTTAWGLGISNAQLDYIVPTGMTHNFYVNAVKIMGVSGAAGAGNFNNTATTPTGTTRLNWEGYLYPTFLNLTGSGDTATAASHYFVEAGSDGFVRPKTLANVKTEIVTTAAVNSASATTVGTITSGIWNGTSIAIANGGTGQTTANAALNALLPSQATHATKVLQTDGTNTSWVSAASGSGTVTSVGGTGSYGGLTLTGTVTTTGNLTLGGTPTGTWPISVTGNAATLSGFQVSNTVSMGDTIAQNAIGYVGSVSILGQTDGALYSQFYNTSWQHQIYGDYRTGQIAVRGKNNGTWQAWRTVIDSTSISSQSVSHATTANSLSNTAVANTNGTDGWFRSPGATGWYNSTYAVGWYATQAGRVDAYNSASIYSAGNITAYSDERTKYDWKPLVSNFVEELAKIKSGTYSRTDSELRQAGISAQDLQKILTEAVPVSDDENKTLSVAYGNAAMVSAVELAKEVVALKAMINNQQEMINVLVSRLDKIAD